MNVLYTCDDNYVWIMGISVISLFENNRHIRDLSVILLGECISDYNKSVLENIANKYKRKIHIFDVPGFDIPSALMSTRWPLSAFTRLFSGQLLPDSMKKVLYLDCDTIIRGNIDTLDCLKFDGNILLGVKDCISGKYKENIGLNKKSIYINAGVILFDLVELRKIDVSRAIEIYLNKYLKAINYADQDILNGIFKGKIGELEPVYDVMTINAVYSYEEILQLRRPTNFYSKKELSKAVQNPVIIHYTTNMLVVRPWFLNDNHPLSEEFRKYMDISPWRKKNMELLIFDSREAKIITLINKLPKCMAYRILGLIHSELKPIYIRMKAR